MKIWQALMCGKRELIESRVQRPSLESEILLAYILETTREWIHTWSDRDIDIDDFHAFMSCISRRKQHYPLEYITHQVSFYGRDFYINPSVLIPRPETELLIDALDSIISTHHIKHVAEIGVGSGVIAITLALKHPELEIIATDISLGALDVAWQNICALDTPRANLKDRISLIQTNLLDNINREFDLLVSNPPYIALDYPLEQHVLQEPHHALFGGVVGDEMLRLIINLARTRNIRFLACEIGYDQSNALAHALEQAGYDAIFYKDYANFYRGFVAEIAAE